MTTTARPIGIYYEHPDWFRPLFAELDRRGTRVINGLSAFRVETSGSRPVPGISQRHNKDNSRGRRVSHAAGNLQIYVDPWLPREV